MKRYSGMDQLRADSSPPLYRLSDPEIPANPYPLSAIWTHDLIACQAALRPAALAVRDEKHELTFLELDQRANRLARHIQALGAGAETPVGLYFERAVDFVVAALAVLKTGGAYVPLDTAYPPARIDAILKDASAPVLLSHKCMAASLAGGPWETVDLDIDAATIESYSAEALATQVAGLDLAYIIYTSGSTGWPKGVEVTHANLLHLIRWYQRAGGVSPNDRASQMLGLAFDAAVLETWGHLAAGASLHFIDEFSRRSAEGLRDWLVAQEVTIGFVPAVTAEQLITFDWPDSTALRILVAGGDTLHRYPNPHLPFVLENQYGPTECTVVVTSGPVPSGGANGQLPSIGRPIDDTEILITDAKLERVPAGEEGEICVSGPQVARGYRNLPELTAEKFVREKSTGQRVYRTGDRGRVLPDGQIAFLGRMDDQIKIRGFRVEPDEVVAQLNSHPQIRNSAVVSRSDNGGEKALIAYLVSAESAELTTTQLREYLQSRVPEYMIPSVFVSLPSLPVTTTGKCDKQALPAPSPKNLLPESFGPEPPNHGSRNGTEASIAHLVSGLMDGRTIGPDDNFFLVGGHSLMAAQLLARLRETLAVSLNLRQLFEAPTIASLAAVVDQKLTTE
ncbi:MAG: non-ribosomal peptide synthetase [Bryobacteraceae bacterium]